MAGPLAWRAVMAPEPRPRGFVPALAAPTGRTPESESPLPYEPDEPEPELEEEAEEDGAAAAGVEEAEAEADAEELPPARQESSSLSATVISLLQAS